MIKKLLTGVIGVMMFISCTDSPKQDSAAQKKDNGASQVTTRGENCLNCGMSAGEFPKWNVRVKWKDTDGYFCSPRCMFIQHLAPGNTINSADSLLVTDYYDLKRTDARTAWFVTQSDILGPMGHDLVPFSSEAAAGEFKEEHKGGKVLKFSEVTKQEIAEMMK